MCDSEGSNKKYNDKAIDGKNYNTEKFTEEMRMNLLV